jgi:hypothetical protein
VRSTSQSRRKKTEFLSKRQQLGTASTDGRRKQDYSVSPASYCDAFSSKSTLCRFLVRPDHCQPLRAFKQGVLGITRQYKAEPCTLFINRSKVCVQITFSSGMVKKMQLTVELLLRSLAYSIFVSFPSFVALLPMRLAGGLRNPFAPGCRPHGLEAFCP